MWEFILRKKQELFFVSALLFVQILISMGYLTTPFLDGRLHGDHYNAKVLHTAVISNDSIVNSWQDIFGFTLYDYDENGKVAANRYDRPDPVFPRAIFTLYSRVFGSSDWVPRSFALLLTMLSSIVLFLLMLRASRSLYTTALLSLLFCFLPIQFSSQLYFFGLHLAALFALLAFYAFARLNDGQRYRWGFLTALFLGLLSSWVFLFAAVFLAIFLFLKRERPNYAQLWQYVLGLAIVSVLLSLIIFSSMGYAPSVFLGIFTQWSAFSSLDLNPWSWVLRQFNFLDYNFNFLNVFIGLVLLIFIVTTKTYTRNILFLSGFVFFIMGFLTISLFPTLSYYDPYFQGYLSYAYILSLAGFLINIKKRIWVGPHILILGFGIIIPLALFTFFSAHQLRSNITEAAYGTIEDMRFIKSVDKRLLYFSNGYSGPVSWWESPVIRLYTDRIYQKHDSQLGALLIDAKKELTKEEDLIVLSSTVSQALRAQILSRVLAPNLPVVYKKTPSFIFYTWKELPSSTE